MKKVLPLFLTALLFFCLSCSDLKRNNPYDPDGTAYVGITYKGDQWYPSGADIQAMIVNQGVVTLAALDATAGYCVIRITGDSTDTTCGSTGDTPGYFRNINDLCADDSGNLYVTDNKTYVQVIDPAGAFTSWPAVHVNPLIDKLHIECLNGNIFISNNLDMTITKYSLSGVNSGSLSLTTTAYGDFTPGNMFVSANHLYVVNDLDQSQVVKLTDTLAQVGLFDFQADILDGTKTGQQMQLAATQAMYKVDEDLGLTLKWGNFGVGPGKILNGKLAAYDAISSLVYVLDGSTIKIFGE